MIAIFQFSDSEAPGYLSEYLQQRGLAAHVFRPDKGDTLPDPQQFAAVALLGGSMSVNDGLSWIAPLLDFIRAADSLAIPVLGHCLGGQLIARAFAAEVTDNTCFEIGWYPVTVADTAAARDWFADLPSFTAFHWHYQTFALPAGAELLLHNRHCAHQAFILRRNIAFQCHIEMTESLVRQWCEINAGLLISIAQQPAVQAPTLMLSDLPAKVLQLNAICREIYDRWLALADQQHLS